MPAGPYRVAFSTRLGGVSDGSFESLNLGILTADEPQNVVENRTRLCAAVDADPGQATMAWQVHGERVTEADARGIVTPGTPVRALRRALDGRAAPRAHARHRGLLSRRARSHPGPPRLTVLHVGWRGLLGGIAAEGVAAMAGNGIAAAIGPGIGPCCYEVGEEVAEPFRTRFGDDVWTAATSTSAWPRSERCSKQDAPRSSATGTARPARRISSSPTVAIADARADRESLPTSPELTAQIRANYERIRSEVGPDVTVVAATKYASPAQMTLLADAGIEVVGENRLQDLVAKQAEVGDRFRWHFIGHLQSRKAKEVSGLCELVHSLDSLSAAKRLSAPALVEVNLGGEESKSGGLARGARRLPAGRPGAGGGGARPHDDAPPRRRPGAFPALLRELRALAGEHGLTELSMGSSQDYRVAAEEGATLVRVGSVLFGR